ncbi:MAG: nucleotidyltransferase family protein [Alphaproteobacteria bacterium]|nr:nucleotidyltransferase family protein [Alphaproteobacteria bacterium]
MRESAAGLQDWDALLRTARRHRVEGLVHDGLRQAKIMPPAHVAEQLAAAAAAIARDNLRFAAEAARLDRLLRGVGVDFLFLKGVTLNLLAYGTLALKRAIDIDLVVDPAGYEAAIAAVEEGGYRCVQPREGASRAEILAWAKRAKHSVWTNGSIMVELHSAFVDSERMLGEVGIESPRQEVVLPGGIILHTLARDELFAYLAVHGATHAWSRLKWLADVGAFAAREPEAVQTLYRRSLALGAGRSGGQALLLAHDLLALPLPPALLAELRGDRAIRYLARVAVDAMTAAGTRELDDLVLGTAAIHLSHLRLKKGLGFKLHEIRRKLRSGEHGEARGPAKLFARVLAAPRWLARRARRAALQR